MAWPLKKLGSSSESYHRIQYTSTPFLGIYQREVKTHIHTKAYERKCTAEKGRNSSNAYQLMNGQTKCDIYEYIQWNIIWS